MISVKLSYPKSWYWPLERQTPGQTAIWNNCRFLINQPVERCDYWVVFEHLDQAEITHCPPENTLLITGEPPSVRGYSGKFVRQFAAVITCHTELHGSELIHYQQGLPWHVGRRQRNNLTLEKTKLISVISSDKAFTPGHRRRKEFVAKLGEHFGPRLDIFGRGVREVEDKWDALAPYKCHLALENFSYPHYWTEKLSDSYLAYSYPIYAGCPNVGDYFPNESLSLIHMDQPDEAIKTIEECLEGNLWENSQEARDRARELVLDRYNLFPMMADFIEERVSDVNRRAPRVRIRPDELRTPRLAEFVARFWGKFRS